MRVTGLEPARRGHQNLNLARLPIPPHPRKSSGHPINISNFADYVKYYLRLPKPTVIIQHHQF